MAQFLPASPPAYPPRISRRLALGLGVVTLVATHAHAQTALGAARPVVRPRVVDRQGRPPRQLDQRDPPGPHRLHLDRDVRRARALRRHPLHRLQLRQYRGAAQQPNRPTARGARRLALAGDRAGTCRSVSRRTLHEHSIRGRNSQRCLSPAGRLQPAPSGLATTRGLWTAQGDGSCPVARERVMSPPSSSGATGVSGSGPRRGIFPRRRPTAGQPIGTLPAIAATPS